MQISRQNPTPTTVKLTIAAEPGLLNKVYRLVVTELGRNVKVQGFRAGKAPQHIIEKQLDHNVLQSEFLDRAVNSLYTSAVQQEKLRPVAQPTVSITKFVPFSALEIMVEVEAVGTIKLPNYKQLKLAKKSTSISAHDVNEVIANLRQRAAAKEAVQRPAKAGDEVIIDFAGTDTKTKQPIAGADGKDYPLLLGSNSFIPGFEDNLVGHKAGDNKSFQLTFPKNYGVQDLQNKVVSFTVKIKSIQKLTAPKLDDDFAAQVSPFKTVTALKADIKKQLQAERNQQAEREYENQLLEKISAKSTIAIPEALIDEEIDRLEEEERRNLVYRGQTWSEHLTAEGISESQHRAKNRPAAELRVKAGLVLSEIADREQITVTPEELEIRLQLLKGQYTDPSMQSELDKPENRRDILSRLLTEKTLDKLKSFTAAS